MIALRGAIHVACFIIHVYTRAFGDALQKTWMSWNTPLFFSAQKGGVELSADRKGVMQFVAGALEILAAITWPVVALIAIVVYFTRWRRILESLAGFVGRSCYRMGNIPDDWTLDRVSVKNFCGCKCTDKVIEKIKEMQKGGYSFAPIVDEEGRALAVFTPTCVQRIALGVLKIDIETDFAALLDVADGKFEDMNVGAYRFIAEGDSVKSIRRYFETKWGDKEDFGIVFVTKCGSSSEPLKGVVTVWDVINK